MERVDQFNSILWNGDFKAFGRKAGGLDLGTGHGRQWLWLFGQLERAKHFAGRLLQLEQQVLLGLQDPGGLLPTDMWMCRDELCGVWLSGTLW